MTTSNHLLTYASPTIQDDNDGIHHEHMGAANKSDVSPNTPKAADEADL
jgi:hypothetical protein